jgi:hypothetical protein
MSSNGADKMPERMLVMDPTRKDAGIGLIRVVVTYDPLRHDVQVQGPKGMDIVGILGILELGKAATIAMASARK